MHCNYSSTFFEEQASISPQSFLLLSKTLLYYVFLHCQFYSPAFFLQNYSIAIKIVLEFFSQNTRSKTPATSKAVGLWLYFYATIGLFMLLLARAYILCPIARSNNIKHIFFVVLRGCKRLD
jgi:hypothetical protein